MKDNSSIYKNIIAMSDLLPECCQSFLWKPGLKWLQQQDLHMQGSLIGSLIF